MTNLQRQISLTSASLFLLCASLGAQAIQSERVIAAGHLWTTIKYFHPWLVYRDIDWDQAWVQAYPKIKSAPDAEAYAKAVEEMLARLRDPATRVIRQPPPEPTDGGPIQVKWEPGSVLTITVPYSHDLNGMIDQLRKAANEVSKASAVILDMRSASEEFTYPLSVVAGNRFPTTQTVFAPAERRRFHSGLASESGSSSGGYHSGFQVREGQRFDPVPSTTEKRWVFVVSERTFIPLVAVALQTAGNGTIVSEGTVTDEKMVATSKVQLLDGLQVKVRLGELLYPDGTAGFVPDIVVDEGKGIEAALAAAAQSPVSKLAGRTRVALIPVQGPRSSYPESAYPPPAYRVLAALQIWAVHNYFFPYKKLMDRDWNEVLKEFLPSSRRRRMNANITLAWQRCWRTCTTVTAAQAVKRSRSSMVS